MAIPSFQSFMLPLLEYASDGQDHSLSDARLVLADRFSLSEEEQQQLQPSGRQTVFYNRVGWARTYLAAARLLESPRRGCFKITERGRAVLRDRPKAIDADYLERFPEFVEFRTYRRPDKVQVGTSAPTGEHKELTPEEALDSAYQRMRTALAEQLLVQLKNTTPQFFERLVVDLLVGMGYGGSRQDAGRAIGRSGDEGIDGVIDEDRLGLDVVYLQAKRWDGTVGRPEIQRFVGALHGKKARKGVFLTTGRFSQDAHDYVQFIDPKVVLIDGDRLAQLMIDFGIGVSTVAAYEIKTVDTDYFDE